MSKPRRIRPRTRTIQPVKSESLRRERPEPLRRFSRDELALITIATTIYAIGSDCLAGCVVNAQEAIEAEGCGKFTNYQVDKIYRWLQLYERDAPGYIRFFPKIISSEILDFAAAS